MSAIDLLSSAWDGKLAANSPWNGLSTALVTLWMQAALVLLLALLVRRSIRHPVLRVTLAWATVAGLTVLPLLAAVPGWRVVALLEMSPVPEVSPSVATEPSSSTSDVSIASAAPVDPPETRQTDSVTAEPVAESALSAQPVDLPSAPSLPEPQETAAVVASQPADANKPRPEAEPVEEPCTANAPTVVMPTSGPETPEPVTAAANTTMPPAAAHPSPIPPRSPAARLGVASVVGLFAAAVVVLFWTLLGKCVVWRLLLRSHAAPPELTEELDSLLPCTSLRRRPRLLLSPDLATPAAVGSWRPAILLPEHAAVSISRDSLRAALRHELAHIERGDLWLLAWARWLSPLYATQPLWWLFRRAMRSDQELTADAIAAGDDPVGYAEALVAWAKEWHTEAERRSWIARSWFGRSWGRIGRPGFLLSDSPGSLTRRVAMLLDPRRLLSGRISRWFKAGLVLVLVFGTVVASLVAVSDPGAVGAWWRGMVDAAKPQPVFASIEAITIPTPVDRPSDSAIPANYSTTGGNIPSAHVGFVSDPIAQVERSPSNPPPSTPKLPSNAPAPNASVRTECVVGWVDDEKVAAATGAVKLVLPEGEPVGPNPKDGPSPLGVWLKSADMSFRLKLAEENGLVKILSSPTIVARLNETAESFSGGELPQVRIIERRNGATPPSHPIPSAVRIGLELELTVRDSDPLTFPVDMTIPHLVDLKIAWSTRRDETTIDRQVLAGAAAWPREGMSLFLVEPPFSADQPAEPGRKRLFAMVTPHKLSEQETEAIHLPARAQLDPFRDRNASPPTSTAPGRVNPPTARPSPTTPPAPVLPESAPSVPTVPAPTPPGPFAPDVQYFDPAPVQKPATPDTGVRVKVRKLVWKSNAQWTINKGKPNQETFPLNPARTWNILPMAAGDQGFPLTQCVFQVPLRRDFDAIPEEQQQQLWSQSITYLPNGGRAEPLEAPWDRETTESQPVENGVAKVACPEPLFPTVVVQPGTTPFLGVGSAALDVVVRPDYGLMSDGSPGLKGFSGVLRLGAMLDAEIGARHADLPPSRLARMLLNRDLPMLCPFQVPPGGGLIVFLSPSTSLNLETETIDDEGDLTTLFISFESTLSEDNRRRVAETQLANRPKTTVTPDQAAPATPPATPSPPRSLDDARKELQRLIDDYPSSLTPLSDIRQAIVEYVMASLRQRVAELSVEPPGESPQARVSRLERLAAPLFFSSMISEPWVGTPERTASNTMANRLLPPVAPQYADELRALIRTLTQQGEKIEALEKSLENNPGKPAKTPPVGTGNSPQTAPARRPDAPASSPTVSPPGAPPEPAKPAPSGAPPTADGKSQEDNIEPPPPPKSD